MSRTDESERGLREAVAAFAADVKRAANDDWTTHSEAADRGDVEAANVHGYAGEVRDDVAAYLRALLVAHPRPQGRPASLPHLHQGPQCAPLSRRHGGRPVSVRVWQSCPPDKRGLYADWEMECVEHAERHTSANWIWAMEAAWGHIAMHHQRPPCTHEWTSRSWLHPGVGRCLDCGIPL